MEDATNQIELIKEAINLVQDNYSMLVLFLIATFIGGGVAGIFAYRYILANLEKKTKSYFDSFVEEEKQELLKDLSQKFDEDKKIIENMIEDAKKFDNFKESNIAIINDKSDIIKSTLPNSFTKELFTLERALDSTLNNFTLIILYLEKSTIDADIQLMEQLRANINQPVIVYYKGKLESQYLDKLPTNHYFANFKATLIEKVYLAHLVNRFIK